ncbi:MAG: hypothetical protein IJP31_07665 [Lachnospiraceae bacterium]|nr:hypothetical protein [Lachnospiraceae bacterium]
MKVKEISCPSCKEKLQVPEGRDSIFCMFCGKAIELTPKEQGDFCEKTFQGQIVPILISYPVWIKKFSREEYPAAFERFCKEQKVFLEEVDKGIAQNQSARMVELVIRGAGEAGKQLSASARAGEVQHGMNTLMAVYVIPAIIRRKRKEAPAFCKQLKEAWAVSFKDSRIKVSDFETIWEGFNVSFFDAWFKRR